jgi:hypothetical protein
MKRMIEMTIRATLKNEIAPVIILAMIEKFLSLLMPIK